MTTEITEKRGIASESFHWYKRDGSPCHEVENKSKPGEMRATTLRDAKKLDLVPSTTSVLQILAKPALNVWKMEQVLMSALTIPRIVLESDKAFVTRILLDADEQAHKASEKGVGIHGSIEKYLDGKSIEEMYVPYVIPVINEFEKRGWLNNRKVEHSFAHPNGFGGKVDYHNDKVLLDIKSKDFENLEKETIKKLIYDEQLYQIASYRFGLQMPHLQCFEVYVSRTLPGLFHIHQWDESDLNKGEIIFLRTLDLFKLIKGI